MSDCVAESHLRELGESAVAEYDCRIASIPPELCAPFNITAMRFEDELLRIYKSVVFCVRDEQDLQKVASWWAFMVNMCDLFAGRLSGLKTAHPTCGADYYYDNILDLRNKCRRLQEMHL
jgi:hypothetical protein